MKTLIFLILVSLIGLYSIWPKTEFDKADLAYKEARNTVQMLKEKVARQKLKYQF